MRRTCNPAYQARLNPFRSVPAASRDLGEARLLLKAIRLDLWTSRQ